ncbi:MAG TPA: heavy metal-associated domain-containing protein [Propionibacteriaceae bacterium]|nr:heavy metal-associated domain-containing protein [Propionibacteriaceae bacterium]
MPTTDYVVTGMTCDHCVRAVTEEVSALDGVDDVAVDLTSGRLTVTSSSDVPYASVAAAVDEAGYALSPA